MSGPEPKSPYLEGYGASQIPPSKGQPACPYPEGDPRHDEWWDGFGQGTDDWIAYNNLPDEE